MGPGIPSNELRGPVAHRCARFPPAGCVRSLANLVPKRPPRAPGWAPVESGGCILRRNPLGQRVGSLLLVFSPFSPRQRCCWVQIGNGPKRGPMAPGHAPGLVGSGGRPSGDRILGWNPLGQRAGCLLVTFACFSPANGAIWPQNSPNGPKMGLKMAKIDFLQK